MSQDWLTSGELYSRNKNVYGPIVRTDSVSAADVNLQRYVCVTVTLVVTVRATDCLVSRPLIWVTWNSWSFLENLSRNMGFCNFRPTGGNHLVLDSCRIIDQTLSIIDITPLKRYTLISPSIHCCFSKLFQGDTEVFPNQLKDISFPACPGSCPKHLTKEVSRKHPNQILNWLGWLLSMWRNNFPNNWAPYPISKAAYTPDMI